MIVTLCNDREWLMSKEAYSIYAPCLYQPSLDRYTEKMENYISDPSFRIFVCEENGIRSGILILNGSAEIEGIAVAENARLKGVGRFMIEEVMRSEDLSLLKAQTDDDSIGFYRRCGFVDECVIIEYPNGSVTRYNCVLARKGT